MQELYLMMNHAELNQALLSVEKELKRDSKSWEAWSCKADILHLLGLFESSIQCCNESLSLNPESALTWITKGEVLDKLGIHDDAEKAFEKARLLDEDLSRYKEETRLLSDSGCHAESQFPQELLASNAIDSN
jgi:tetratricopeptide (TPR) repeat protein